MFSLRNISIALFITSVSSLSLAQSTAPRTPDTIGVEPADAREAMERARRREAEATVVPNQDTAAQPTRNATGATRDEAAAVGNRARSAGATNSDPSTTASGTGSTAGTRASRADRN